MTTEERFYERRLPSPKMWQAVAAIFVFGWLGVQQYAVPKDVANKQQLSVDPNLVDAIADHLQKLRTPDDKSSAQAAAVEIPTSSPVEEKAPDFFQQCRKLGPNVRKILDELKSQYGNIRLDKSRHGEFERWCHNRRNGCMFVSVRSGRLTIKSMYPSMQSRHHSLIMAMYRVSSKVHLPDVDFAIEMWDGGADGSNLPLFRFSRDRDGDQSRLIIPIPDFTFYTWPESVCGGEKSHAFSYLFSRFKELEDTMEKDPVGFVQKKRNRLVYRGAPIDRRPGWVRQINSVVWKQSPKPDVDVALMKWAGHHNIRGDNPAQNCMTILDQCDNKYLMHMDGVRYSSRLKYLMGCGGVVLMPQPRWEEWWFLGVPTRADSNENNELFIQLNEDLSDFQEKFGNLYYSDQSSKESRVVQIVERSQKFAIEVFSEESVDCYWAHVIQLAANLWGPIGGDYGKPIEDAMINPNDAFSVI